MNKENKKEVVTRDQRREELEQTEFQSGVQGGALMNPRNGRELMDMANMMSSSGQMIRDFYRNNPGDCAALIMICQPYGFNPFQVSWKTYKASKTADAPVSFEAQLVNAMVNQSAPVKGRLKYAFEGEGETRKCIVTGVDRETEDIIDYTSPEIGKITIKNSPVWKSDPDQQLAYYSARNWARRHFPELLLGVYAREEIEEAAPMKTLNPEKSASENRLRKAAEERRQLQEGSIEPEPEEADDEVPAKQVEDDIPEAEIVPDEETEGEASEEVGQEPETTEEPQTPEFDEAEVFPGDDAFEEGAAAFQAGSDEDANPHDSNPDYSNWIGGYRGAKKASE